MLHHTTRFIVYLARPCICLAFKLALCAAVLLAPVALVECIENTLPPTFGY